MDYYNDIISSNGFLAYFLGKMNLYDTMEDIKSSECQKIFCNFTCAVFIYFLIILISIGNDKHIDFNDWPLINNNTNFTKYYSSNNDIEVVNDFNNNFIGKFPNCMDFIISFISLGFTFTISKQSKKISVISFLTNIILFYWEYNSFVNLVPQTYRNFSKFFNKNITNSEMIIFHLNTYYDVRITNILFNLLIKSYFLTFFISSVEFTITNSKFLIILFKLSLSIFYLVLVFTCLPVLLVTGIFYIFHILILLVSTSESSRVDNGYDLFLGYIFGIIPFSLIFVFWILMSPVILNPFQKIVYCIYSIDICCIFKKCKSLEKEKKKIVNKNIPQLEKHSDERSLKVDSIKITEEDIILTLDKKENLNNFDKNSIEEEIKLERNEDGQYRENSNDLNLHEKLFQDETNIYKEKDVQNDSINEHSIEEIKVSTKYFIFQCKLWKIIIIYKLYICFMNISAQFCYYYYMKMNIFSIIHIFISIPYFSLNIYSFQINSFIDSTIDLYSKISSLI